jgi:zeaxanthin glucosyltransferase
MGKLSGIAALKYNFPNLPKTSRVILKHAPSAIKKLGVEALLVDQFSPEGGTVADILNLPFVTVCNGLILNREPTILPALIKILRCANQ